MKLIIVEIRSASPGEWDEMWAACEFATYFQSRTWAEVWKVYTKGRFIPDARLVRFSDDARVVLPFSRQRLVRGLAYRRVMSPAGTYGGWLASEPLTDQHRSTLVSYIGSGVRDLFWRINPFDGTDPAAGLPYGATDDETHVLNLSAGFDAVLRGWTKGHRSAANKAEREGVQIVPARADGEWRADYAIYRESVRRWGERATSHYGWELFDLLRRRPESDLRLWLALHEGEVAAGALCLYSRSHVVYWHGAAAERHFHVRPVNLLLRHAIKHACVEGYRWFDFNPSGGNDGVRSFKKSFGAQAMSAPVIRKTGKIHRYHLRAVGIARRLIRGAEPHAR